MQSKVHVMGLHSPQVLLRKLQVLLTKSPKTTFRKWYAYQVVMLYTLQS